MTAPARQGIPLRPDRAAFAAEQRRSLCRAVAALVLGAAKDTEPAAVLRSAWPDDNRAALVLRAVSNPADTTITALGLDAVTTLPALAPQSAALQLFALGAKLDLGGKHTIAVPNVAVPPAPVFIAENMPAPSTQLTFAKTLLGPVKKILVLSAITREIEAATPEGAAVIVARLLSDAIAKGIDVVALGTGAGDTTTPSGLLHGVTPITAAAAGSSAMVEDISNLTKAITDAWIDPSNVVFIAATRQAMALKLTPSPLFDNPVILAANLPNGTVIAAAPAGIYFAYDGSTTVESSKEVLIHSEDTAPLPLVSTGGVVAAPQRSFWQTDSISIRCRSNAAWVAYPGSIQIVTGVNWP
jgi:hypothetical protein